MTYIEKSGVAYFAFNRYGDDKSLQAFSEELGQFLREKRPKRLVVDMRNNPGGDFGLGRWYIIRTVMRSSHLLTHGRLFIAVDRSSFSAAFINALDFRRDANAILVGEPPGERPWAYSDGPCNKLPRSGLLACFSTRFYRTTDDDVATIPLDHSVVPTWADFVAGRDPIMDWILAQPEPMEPSPVRVPQK
jgi:C-terminal processing protease CtpA/Prc